MVLTHLRKLLPSRARGGFARWVTKVLHLVARFWFIQNWVSQILNMHNFIHSLFEFKKLANPYPPKEENWTWIHTHLEIYPSNHKPLKIYDAYFSLKCYIYIPYWYPENRWALTLWYPTNHGHNGVPMDCALVGCRVTTYKP